MDPYEVRQYTVWHHHRLTTMLAYCFLWRLTLHLGKKSPALKPATTPIPVQLSEHKFTVFILAHLSMPRRSPKCTRGYRCVFTLIL
jgi:hypothetical protein